MPCAHLTSLSLSSSLSVSVCVWLFLWLWSDFIPFSTKADCNGAEWSSQSWELGFSPSFFQVAQFIYKSKQEPWKVLDQGITSRVAPCPTQLLTLIVYFAHTGLPNIKRASDCYHRRPYQIPIFYLIRQLGHPMHRGVFLNLYQGPPPRGYSLTRPSLRNYFLKIFLHVIQ